MKAHFLCAAVGAESGNVATLGSYALNQQLPTQNLH